MFSSLGLKTGLMVRLQGMQIFVLQELNEDQQATRFTGPIPAIKI